MVLIIVVGSIKTKSLGVVVSEIEKDVFKLIVLYVESAANSAVILTIPAFNIVTVVPLIVTMLWSELVKVHKLVWLFGFVGSVIVNGVLLIVLLSIENVPTVGISFSGLICSDNNLAPLKYPVPVVFFIFTNLVLCVVVPSPN